MRAPSGGGANSAVAMTCGYVNGGSKGEVREGVGAPSSVSMTSQVSDASSRCRTHGPPVTQKLSPWPTFARLLAGRNIAGTTARREGSAIQASLSRETDPAAADAPLAGFLADSTTGEAGRLRTPGDVDELIVRSRSGARPVREVSRVGRPMDDVGQEGEQRRLAQAKPEHASL